MSQLVPSETSSAHLPAVAARMAVPAEPPINGTTLDVADTTVNAAMVRMRMDRPAHAVAVGSVTVMLAPPLQTISRSDAATVNEVVFVTGAGPETEPPTLPLLIVRITVAAVA